MYYDYEIWVRLVCEYCIWWVIEYYLVTKQGRSKQVETGPARSS